MNSFLDKTIYPADILPHSCAEAGSMRPAFIPTLPIAGRNYYPTMKSDEAGLVALLMIVGALSGTIGAAVFCIAMDVGVGVMVDAPITESEIRQNVRDELAAPIQYSKGSCQCTRLEPSTSSNSDQDSHDDFLLMLARHRANLSKVISEALQKSASHQGEAL